MTSVFGWGIEGALNYLRFLPSLGNDATPDLARLPGARMIVVGNSDEPLRADLVRALTCGERIEVRRLNRDFLLAEDVMVLVSGRAAADLFDSDGGFWRRTLAVVWPVARPKNLLSCLVHLLARSRKGLKRAVRGVFWRRRENARLDHGQRVLGRLDKIDAFRMGRQEVGDQNFQREEAPADLNLGIVERVVGQGRFSWFVGRCISCVRWVLGKGDRS